MTKCVIYCRTSGDDTDRDSLGSQESDCRGYADDHDYEIVEVLKEDVKGVSGADFYAPQMQRAIALAKDGLYDILLVRDVTRFARERFKANFVEFELSECGVKLEFVWQQFSDDDNGELMKGIMYLLAQKERSDITKRLDTGKRDKIKRNDSFMVNGNAPLGYKAVKDDNGIYIAEIVESEAKIIRLIFKLYLEDDMSAHTIANILNDDSIPTYSQLRGVKRYKNTVTRWYPSNVANILRNETYCGTFTYGKRGKKVYRDKDGEKHTRHFDNPKTKHLTLKVPPIVSRDDWQKAQVKLKKNHKQRGRKSDYEYLMARRIKCHCSYRMNASSHRNSTGKRYYYYRCTGEKAITKRKCKCAVSAGLVDELAWNWLESLLTPEVLGEKLQNYIKDREREIKRLNDKLYPLEHYLEELDKRYNKLIRSYLASDDFGQSKLEVFKQELEQEMQTYQDKCYEVRQELDVLKLSVRMYQEYVKDMTEYGHAFWLYYDFDHFNFSAENEAHARFDYDLANSLIEDNERELTYEDKLKRVKQFNLQAEIVLEDGEEKLKLTCDLGETVCKMNNSKFFLVQLPNTFSLVFSDVLVLDLRDFSRKREMSQTF